MSAKRERAMPKKAPEERKRSADANRPRGHGRKDRGGRVEDDRDGVSRRCSGDSGGKKRAANMTPERRAEIARKAAAKRWSR